MGFEARFRIGLDDRQLYRFERDTPQLCCMYVGLAALHVEFVDGANQDIKELHKVTGCAM